MSGVFKLVDPSALAKKKEKEQSNFAINGRAFLFSILGAVIGGIVCLVLDYFLMGNITGIFYIFPGMSAYAFYQYFVEIKDQRKIHLLILSAACILGTVLTVFLECMVLYAPRVEMADMNILEKVFHLYSVNLSNNGIVSYKQVTGSHEVISMSLLAYHIMCAFLSVVSMLCTSLVLGFMSHSWEKKHPGANANYSYTSRKKKGKKKK